MLTDNVWMHQIIENFISTFLYYALDLCILAFYILLVYLFIMFLLVSESRFPLRVPQYFNWKVNFSHIIEAYRPRDNDQRQMSSRRHALPWPCVGCNVLLERPGTSSFVYKTLPHRYQECKHGLLIWIQNHIVQFVSESRYAVLLRRFAFAAALIKQTIEYVVQARATARHGTATRSRRSSGIFQCCCCYAGYTTRLWRRMFARHSYAINSNIARPNVYLSVLAVSHCRWIGIWLDWETPEGDMCVTVPSQSSHDCQCSRTIAITTVTHKRF